MIYKYFYPLLSLLAFISCTSKMIDDKELSSDELTKISFKKEKNNLGKIPAGKDVYTVFQFINTGENPLLIKEVTTSCGCTVPEWDKEIIKPNGSGKIKIVYDAKYPGRFNKTVTVVYNGKDSPLQLTIEGEVIYSNNDNL